MKKLFLLAFTFMAVPLWAADDSIPDYKGFPVYPPETIKKYEGKDTAHIKVLLSSYDFIQESKQYIETAAARLGWQKKKQSLEAPLTQVYIKENDKTKMVKVRFNREMGIDGSREVEMYYDSPQGSVEYTFLTVDTSTVYHINKIVSTKRSDVVDAYINLLKEDKFEDVATKYSESSKLAAKVSIDPLSSGVMEREIMRLLPGQISDVFQGEDNKFYLIKLIEVTRDDQTIRHVGLNTEDRRPSSVDLTYSGKDSSLVEVMVDSVKK